MRKVAVGILRQNGKVLACQRRRGGRYELKWEFPGGKVEPGETVLRCLERELHEELSVNIHGVGRIEVETSEYADGGLFEVAYCFVAGFEGQPTNNVFEQILWVTPDELRTLDILEGNRDFVAKLQ